jgi:hypothetical protein
MYLLDAPTTIEWVLGITPNTLLFSDLHLIIVHPSGESVFLTSPIAEEDFTAPTSTVRGLASYEITPDEIGFWKVHIAKGTDLSYTLLSEVDLQVKTGQTNVITAEIR